MYTGKNTGGEPGGASVARGAFISPTAFEQRGEVDSEVLWEREGAAGFQGGNGGVVIEGGGLGGK